MGWPESANLLAPLAPWFDAARRDLPWRAADLDGPHPDPYAVLVSELMLQQTQVATVIPYFQRWMARLPDASTLAGAPEETVHKLWEGLGYYRRARLLQAAARRVADSGWPRTLEGLMELPGLGAYTGAAVAAIAFQLPTPALDGNAFRVLARLLGLEEDPRRHAERMRGWLVPALERLGPSRLTQAIMELGALVCAPAPRCEACPLAAGCLAMRLGSTDRIPARSPRPAPRELALWLLALRSEAGWLVQPPAARGLLAGLWQWPSLPLEAGSPLASEAVLPYGIVATQSWLGWTQVYSHRRERIHPLSVQLQGQIPAPGGHQWIAEDRLATLPMGRRDGRLRELLGAPTALLAEGPPVAGLLEKLGIRA